MVKNLVQETCASLMQYYCDHRYSLTHWTVFTARCYTQSARLCHSVLSVTLPVCNVQLPWSHRWNTSKI